MKIGVSGGVGSFSEEAGETYMKMHGYTDAEIVPLVRHDSVLEALQKDEIEIGILAVQNSISGIVHSAVYAMSEYPFVADEFFEVVIDQNLLIKPGTKASAITTITSQRPALDQCQAYLSRTWEGITIDTYVDTATAAKDLAEGTLPETTAVVAPKRCAYMYGLEVLEESIQDLKDGEGFQH